MTSTKTQTSKTSTTPTAPKAATPKRITLNAHAMKSLGILVVTESSMVEDWNAAQDLRAKVAFDAYALVQGWAGKAKSQAEVAKLLGTSKGNVSALTRAGAILNRAGTHASAIGSMAVTLCQNSNAGQTAHLDALTSKALADAVRKASVAALAGKATSQHRAPSTAGKGKGSTGKGNAAPKVDVSTNAGRMTVVVQTLNAVTRDANDDSRDAILAACDKAQALIEHVREAYAVKAASVAAQVNAGAVTVGTRKGAPKA